jgi:hypothetical protein
MLDAECWMLGRIPAGAAASKFPTVKMWTRKREQATREISETREKIELFRVLLVLF